MKPGQKVVCITKNMTEAPSCKGRSRPKYDEVVTIRSVHNLGNGVYFSLHGYAPDSVFASDCFRPIEEIGESYIEDHLEYNELLTTF